MIEYKSNQRLANISKQVYFEYKSNQRLANISKQVYFEYKSLRIRFSGFLYGGC
jgi:hypothetical protein